MTDNIQIRNFRTADLIPLFNLVQNVIVTTYPKIYPWEAVEYFKEHHTMEDIQGDAGAGFTVVAECDGELLGTGTLLDTNIRRVYVSPIHQHLGIGKRIFLELEREALHRRVLLLDLSASLISMPFWKSVGFVIQSEDFIPVQNGQKLHYYTMVKTLYKSDSF
ncbi:MAG: GNAT family N-acetyltransferase [Nitrospira sp.]|nr:GNAT family N-acetyltransferase [Nitrospira sp.]